MATAFFGGSFDPPHAGHMAVASGALASGKCDQVLWVPAFAPPHKLDRERAPFEHRMKMVELLIDGHPAMRTSDIEARRSVQPSYTIDSLEALKHEGFPDLLLLIGADSLLELHTWKRCRELVKNYPILTYPRRGSEITAAKLAAHWEAEQLRKLLDGVLDGKFFEISSSGIRNSMEKNTFTGNIKEETEITPALAEYIDRCHLYGKS